MGLWLQISGKLVCLHCSSQMKLPEENVLSAFLNESKKQGHWQVSKFKDYWFICCPRCGKRLCKVRLES